MSINILLFGHKVGKTTLLSRFEPSRLTEYTTQLTYKGNDFNIKTDIIFEPGPVYEAIWFMVSDRDPTPMVCKAKAMLPKMPICVIDNSMTQSKIPTDFDRCKVFRVNLGDQDCKPYEILDWSIEQAQNADPERHVIAYQDKTRPKYF